MLIDFHVHIGGLKHWREYMPWVLDLVATFSEQNGLDRTRGNNGEIEPDLLLQFMDEVGLDYAVIVVDYFALDWVADF